MRVDKLLLVCSRNLHEILKNHRVTNHLRLCLGNQVLSQRYNTVTKFRYVPTILHVGLDRKQSKPKNKVKIKEKQIKSKQLTKLRWEEDKRQDGVKWSFLEHKGPVFAPPYERLPKDVKFFYDGDEMKLSEETEEVAGFYAKMLDHDYTTKDIFNNNFFKDWRKVMTDKERSKITNLSKCNFKQMHAYFMDIAEKNRNRTKEEKQALKEKNEAILKEYGFCTIDGHREKIGNFKIEPPGLFRGRGEHPKMGMLKRRVQPEDVLINCSKDSKIPVAPEGHKWKEVRHDSGVTWLASWTENVQNQVKYVMLNPSSKLKGEKDWQKYETARRLHKCIDKIRKEYQLDWKSKEMRIRQRAVALYFIDKLALRAGNEKDEDQADTVGCCSLRVEHIQLLEHKDDKDYVVVFDFLGKDSIRYYNEVPVEKRVFKNLQLFMENKSTGDDLFDRLNTTVMNKHLNELMEGLTAKVFRTYNASITLQQQLDKLTNPDDSVTEKILAYNRANRAVAILCNHQRSVPKSHQKSMEKLKEKITAKKDAISDAERQVKDAQREAKRGSVKEKVVLDKKKKALQRLKEQLLKLEVQETDRDENKTIALGTSKLNYLDPRISVAWCKKYDVPIDKIYNKTQRDKFRWAIDMAGPDYIF
ncbi:DNA topoisomerase 1 isoform X2 [Onthophagus taurus]|uniref:DNA topoisomerase 1 isoform X2 n=1 Tax=Onthophagus taurus TaxID=166361 RepID=UPI000C2057EA|nr:DNA topoisomerase 1 isoform X2 [Onthophagus taurus]